MVLFFVSLCFVALVTCGGESAFPVVLVLFRFQETEREGREGVRESKNMRSWVRVCERECLLSQIARWMVGYLYYLNI